MKQTERIVYVPMTREQQDRWESVSKENYELNTKLQLSKRETAVAIREVREIKENYKMLKALNSFDKDITLNISIEENENFFGKTKVSIEILPVELIELLNYDRMPYFYHVNIIDLSRNIERQQEKVNSLKKEFNNDKVRLNIPNWVVKIFKWLRYENK